jgi:hypothetical protein
MGVFLLKYRDTLPALQVVLKNPDGTVHNLTGSTAWKLHVWLNDGTKLTRGMTKIGADIDGTLRYTWAATDWDAGTGGPPFTAGGLILGPDLPLAPGIREHWMEYEVIGGTSRLTFPNGGYDTLRVYTDIGQG